MTLMLRPEQWQVDVPQLTEVPHEHIHCELDILRLLACGTEDYFRGLYLYRSRPDEPERVTARVNNSARRRGVRRSSA